MKRALERWAPKIGTVVLMICWLAQPAEGAARKRRPPVSRPASLDVTPDPAVDARVAEEVAKAKAILENPNASNILSSGYLVSAVYYHDGFLNDFPTERNTASPERRIVGQISNLLTADGKARFFRLLHEMWEQPAPPSAKNFAEPVSYGAISGRRSHNYAVDLFAREGSTVRAVARGLVVLAERDWDPENLFSTSSRKGGNAVILFDPDRDRFYRYCHLSTVKVAAGDRVAAGDPLGEVGHTGLNAARTGHGGHLHFETNEFVAGHVRALDYARLRALLRGWRTPSAK